MPTVTCGYRISTLAVGTLMLDGCMTWRASNVAPINFVQDQKPGKVRIERTDASRVVLSQPVVAGDSIRGQQGAVAVKDIKAIAARRFDPLRTLGLVGGIVGAALIACVATDCNSYEVGSLYEVGNLTSSGRRP